MIFQRWNDIPRMRIIHENIPPESVIELQMIVGENQTLALWTFSEGSEVAAHKHPPRADVLHPARALFVPRRG